MDLLPVPSGNLDFNGFPVDPRWRIQTTQEHPSVVPSELCRDKVGDPSCTGQQPATDDAPPEQVLCPASPKGPRGHVNWFPVSYRGQIFWKGWQVPPFLDDDYDLALLPKAAPGSPPDDGGLTEANQGLLALEFNSTEVVENFRTGWWDDFRRSASRWWTPAAKELLDGRDAAVIGLAGLDCVHDCHTELHPVYGLAVKTETSAEKDRWAVFLQNWGIEGCCCQSQHYLDVRRLVIPLRRPPGSKFASIGSGTKLLSNKKGLKATLYAPDAGDDLYLSVGLSAPEEKSRVHGEVELLWTTAGRRAPSSKTARPSRPAAAKPRKESPEATWPADLPNAVAFARLKAYVASLAGREHPAVVEEMERLTTAQIEALGKRWRSAMARRKTMPGDALEVTVNVASGNPTPAPAVADRPVKDPKWKCREMSLEEFIQGKAD